MNIETKIETEEKATFRATYSVEDNKIRLYASERCETEIYQEIKKAGFKWAPYQKLFVAPRWTPSREDLAMKLAGDIEAEETTMLERAQVKSERLETAARGKQAQMNAFFKAADFHSQCFANGQPILRGHHSERKMLTAQKKVERAMNNAVKAGKSIDYIYHKAEGAQYHANHKNNPLTRSKRIKTLLADLRQIQRDINYYNKAFKIWNKVETEFQIDLVKKRYVQGTSYRSYAISSIYKRYENEEINAQELIELHRVAFDENCETRAHLQRWVNHLLGRLGYETSMLGETKYFNGEMTPVIIQTFCRTHGAEKPKATKLENGSFSVVLKVPLPAHIADSLEVTKTGDEWRDLMQSAGYEVPDKKGPPPLLNFRAPNGVSLVTPLCLGGTIYEQVEMSKAEYARSYGSILRSECGTFRMKVCYNPFYEGEERRAPRVAVFLNDSKEHPAPEIQEAKE